jgi:hypothetical protein
MKNLIAVAVLCALSAGAAAQTLSGIKVEPAVAKVGEPVRITGSFDNADNPNCSVRLHFGDGQTQDFKINQLKDVPLVASRTYAKPGRYKVMIEPKTALPTLKCVGANQTAEVNVSAAAAPGSPATVAAASKCPAGWALNARSVNRKTGAFTCTAKAGTALPAAKLDCPAPLGYFENKARGQLGCKP